MLWGGRYVEEGVRSTAVASLETTAKVYKARAAGNDAKFAHIDAADKQKVCICLSNSAGLPSRWLSIVPFHVSFDISLLYHQCTVVCVHSGLDILPDFMPD